MSTEQKATVEGASLDAEALLDLQLPEPQSKAGATAGEPREALREIHSSHGTTIGVWECTPGRFPTVKDGAGEMAQLIAGRATVRGDDGSVHELSPGSLLVLPDGFRGEWEVHETVRKVFAVWVSR